MNRFHASAQGLGGQHGWWGLQKATPSSPWLEHVGGRVPEGRKEQCLWGPAPHPLPTPGLLGFLTPGPKFPGSPSGGDHAALPPSFPVGPLPEAKLGVGQEGGQRSSTVMTEFAQTWKDRLTCLSLANPPHLPWLNSWHHGEAKNSPPPPTQGPPRSQSLPRLPLPECRRDPEHPRAHL